ncbi:hypothetical protein [Nocardia sp. NPDC051570]|uniref:hypothetical protein n=1 Tax=Nocardia sp. NPDC051570 TaxID=3364324 RepID=UPI0037B872F8
MIAPLVLIAVAIGTLGQYALSDRLLERWPETVAVKLRAAQHHSVADLAAIVRTLAGLASLLCLAAIATAVLAISGRTPLSATGLTDPHWWRLLYGIPLGFVEAGVAGMLCSFAGGLAQIDTWPRGEGWVRGLDRSLTGMSWLRRTAVIVIFAGAEEFVLRAAVITAARPSGTIFAIVCAITVGLFVQTLPLTRWTGFLMPLVAATVTVPVHCLLFLAIPDIRPIIIAHAVAVELSIR